MKALITVLITCLFISPGFARAENAPGLFVEAGSHSLDEYSWKNRVLVVFADTPSDPRFVEQMEMLASEPQELLIRDVVVLSDSDPAAKSPLRKSLRPRGFVIALVDKDGVVKLRKPAPWTVREISRSIDKTPLRQDEIRLRRGNGS